MIRCLSLLLFLGLTVLACAGEGADPSRPPFDMAAILADPLEAQTVKTEVEDGIVIEHVTFNGDRNRDGKFIRLAGILAYPEGGRNLPALLWCQGGMGDARTYFPVLFARKGYLCLHITLAKETWNAFAKFDAANPANANLVRLAVEQMRGVTYIANRAEVNANKLGVGGASYGGVFATFVAGADRRIKAGMSFFAGGNHHLGTSLPQFLSLEDLDEIAVFSRTGDGSHYMRHREIPFIWGLPTNDNWFFFPAVVETLRQKPGAKRIAILPHWVHGFPPELDQQLFDWFDIYLKGTRAPYLEPDKMTVVRRGGTLLAEWSWTGTPAARQAELIVSYGRVLPWHGWKNRYYHTVPATIDGQTARAEIPIPEIDLPMLIFGNVYDENRVLISTDPIQATPSALGIEKANNQPVTIGCPRGKLEKEDTAILTGTAQKFGRYDSSTAHSGEQSVALDADAKLRRGQSEVRMMLYNVYEHDHRLFVWLKADAPMTVDVKVNALPPSGWNRPAVQAILASMPEAATIPAKEDIPSFSQAVDLTTKWQRVLINVPFTGVAVEGYELNVHRRSGERATYWIDDVRFETQWRR